MPTYDYECSCGHSLEIQQKFNSAPKKRCPKCGKNSLKRLISGGLEPIIVREATTLGQQAERNNKKFGSSKVAELERSHKDRTAKAKRQAILESKRLPKGATVPDVGEHKPWYGQLDKVKKEEIIGSPEKTKKYIVEGK